MAQFVYALAAKWDAKPFTRVSARSAGAQSKTEIFTLEVPDTANADSVIVAAVPVDAVISSIRFGCDDLGTAGTVSLGFYKRNVDGTYTAVSSAAIASNIDVNAAAVSMTDYRFSVLNIDTVEKAAWELAGLSSRPSYGDLYLGLTTATGTTVVGTASMIVTYSV